MSDVSYEVQLNNATSSSCLPSTIESCFNQDELAKIMEVTRREKMSEGIVATGDGLKLETDVRRSQIVRLDNTEFGWVMQRMAELTEAANKLYNFDLSNAIMEPVQVAIYDESDKGCYEWHTDIGMESLTRKLSISIPLNDGTKYEGGDLEFHLGTPASEPQIAGSAIIFPSYILHRVTPVTRGRRYSMVTWIHGPKWR